MNQLDAILPCKMDGGSKSGATTQTSSKVDDLIIIQAAIMLIMKPIEMSFLGDRVENPRDVHSLQNCN